MADLARLRVLHAVFRLANRHVVVAAGRRVLWHLSAEGVDVGDQLPDLLAGDAAAERRHSVGASFDNGGVDLLGLGAVDPLVVGERRADAAAAVRMAAAAVEGGEEP